MTAAILVLLLVAGCVQRRLKGPDLGRIYNRAAQYHREERNPIIVIPGILGSKLVDGETGTVAWGAFTGKYARPKTPEGARLVSLPMREGASLAELTDGLRPDGVLDRVRIRIFGIPIRILAYFHILGALGAGGYRDETLGLSGAIDYGSDHFSCFQFPYDFRRDLSETAADLASFIEEKRKYVKAEMERRYGVVDPEVRFDIVAHSMGGLLARYYLRYGGRPLPDDGSVPPVTWAGARDVENVILVAPPNAGSVLALRDLVEGVRLGPTLPHYDPAIIGTMPAAYQLLPRTRHRAVIERDDGASLDTYDPEVWERMGWGLAARDQERVLARLLPDVADPATRRRIALDHLHKCLRRAKQFAKALDAPAELPSGVALHLVAGDAQPTASVMTVEPATGRLRVTETQPGDGTVLRSSALLDERVGSTWSPHLVSPVDWSHVTFLFRKHLELTRSPEFTDNILFVLLERSRDR